MSDEDEMQIVKCMGFIDETVDIDNNWVSIIILGDFNTTYSAIDNNGRLTCLRTLLQDLDMVSCNDFNFSDLDYMYKQMSLDHSFYI